MHSPNLGGSIPYVVSGDIRLALRPWARINGFTMPHPGFFRELRHKMEEKGCEMFPGFQLVCEHELRDGIRDLAESVNCTSVTLDRLYAPDGAHPLDVSRLFNEETNLRVEGSRGGIPLHQQMEALTAKIHKEGKPVAFIDDVIFTGDGLANHIERFTAADVETSHVVCGILIKKGEDCIHAHHPDVRLMSVYRFDEVIDEVCERDFYAGVPFSGSLIGNGVAAQPETGIPYLYPFASPEHFEKWSSIPGVWMKRWSKFCLELSIRLWEEIEKSSGRMVHCNELERRPRGIPCDSSRFGDHLQRVLSETDWQG